MRFFFLSFLAISFVVQQFSCCCGIVCGEELGHEEFAQCHGENHADHDCSEHDSDHGDSDHHHHFCVGSHIFFLMPDSQAIDFSPQMTAVVMMADLLKDLATTSQVQGPRSSIGQAALTSQQRRALLCVYSI